MKATVVLMLLFLVLCAFISLRLLTFSVLYDNLLMVSSTRIFRYSVLNSIIFVVLVWSFRSSAGGADEFLPFGQLLMKGELEEQTHSNGDVSDDDDCGSGGYEGDNDDDGSDCEIGYIEDDKETADHDSENNVEAEQETVTDHELENKVEAFISKVIEGWKKELMMDKLQ